MNFRRKKKYFTPESSTVEEAVKVREIKRDSFWERDWWDPHRATPTFSGLEGRRL
jgi:hypothetical protein